MLRTVRDVRDAAGAALVTSLFYGLPFVVGLIQMAMPDMSALVAPEPDRTARYVHMMPMGDDLGDSEEPAPAPPGVEEAEEAQEPSPEPVESAPAPVTEPPPSIATATEEARPRQPMDATQVLKMRSRRPVSGKAAALGALSSQNAPVTGPNNGQGRGRKCEDASGAVQDMGDGLFQVQRSLVDMYVKDLELASDLASVSWHRDEDGKIDGFKIRRIRCGTVLHEAGFRNGDVVHSVNGKRIRTIFGAISAYQKLKHKENLRVEVTDAKGLEKKLRYEII